VSFKDKMTEFRAIKVDNTSYVMINYIDTISTDLRLRTKLYKCYIIYIYNLHHIKDYYKMISFFIWIFKIHAYFITKYDGGVDVLYKILFILISLFII